MNFYLHGEYPSVVQSGEYVQFGVVVTKFTRRPTKAEKTVYEFFTGRSIMSAIMCMDSMEWNTRVEDNTDG